MMGGSEDIYIPGVDDNPDNSIPDMSKYGKNQSKKPPLEQQQLSGPRYGEAECYDCGLVDTKDHMVKRTISEEVGYSSGGESSTSARPAGWSGQELYSPTGNRSFKSQSSGRTFYRTLTVWLCQSCLRKRKDKIFRNWMIALIILIVIVLGIAILVS